MPTLAKNIASNRSKQIRRQKSLAGKTGVGDDPHMVVGGTGSGSTQYIGRSLVDFNWGPAFADVHQITKIELALKTCTVSTHFSYGSAPVAKVVQVLNQWSEGSGGEGAWSAGQYEWPGGGSAKAYGNPPINPATGTAQGEAWMFIDVTEVMRPVVPSGVLMPDGKAGGNGHNYGLLVLHPNELNSAERCIFYAYDATGSGNDPYLRLTYTPVNRQPDAPSLTGPAIGNNSFADYFEGDHSDPDLDPMKSRYIEVRQKGQTAITWFLPANLQAAGSDEVQTGHFSVPLSLATASLKLGTLYEWRAATQDTHDAPTTWKTSATPPVDVATFSAWRDLTITSSAPSVVATNVTSVPAMANALFGGSYSDPQSNPVGHFQIQMRGQAAHADASFTDQTLIVWDTGITLPTTTEIQKNLIARHYAGRSLSVGNYTYRIQVQDSTGVWSTWSYDDFTLTTAYNIDPGAIDLTTQVARNAPVRIALYKMGPKRGPGALIGYIDDPIDLGASGYLNGGGEVYFTLPALHPYCQVLDPMQTHYAVEQWYGDRYRALTEFAGLITDFDGVADDVTFYGTNYLGLLQTAVDERYNPANANQPANGSGAGGSYYINQTIDWVIRDQLAFHRTTSNSPVAFVATAGAAGFNALVERVTIYATYAEALPFIVGLMDSHKQGTGKEARFYARQVVNPGSTTLAAAAAVGATNIKVASVTNFAVGDVISMDDSDVHQITAVGTAGSGGTGITFTTGLAYAHLINAAVTEVSWEWALVDNWGKDRPNIVLEYGGLLNDFRVVALGDFGTRVLAVGQKRGEVKVYRAVGGQPPGMPTGGLDESVWGRRAKTAFFPDIIDQNDLQRRANENASQLSKVGKRMAIAIRADMLAPFDGFDLGDNIGINIVRGVVDTSRYGSLGLWTIYGLEWRFMADGHSELSLTILPKKTSSAPNPDLIGSSNPGISDEWQVGYGKPTVIGNPPVPSHS